MFPPPFRKLRSRLGVTLVELLVVIAIVVALVALIFPVFSSMSGKSRALKCANTLRQIGSAILLYAADHGGRLPSVNQGGAQTQNWLLEISPFLGRNPAVAGNALLEFYDRVGCPTFIAKYRGKPGITATWIGYGMNGALTGPAGKSLTVQLPLASLKDLDRSILVGECPGLNFVPPADGQLPKDPSRPEGWQFNGNVSLTPDRHDGRSNYLFLDGHLRTFTVDEIQRFLIDQNTP